ncbi:hypothetical protein FNU76_02880 [Chitinimonas arctica]|uniref:TIR domain-containing protein n=1 Tax=Chitinimonas arctica TaxID=2594795 RepID=A0A516SB61_9NEIS|nr:leucine-rich repeat domain-containing protein [Chitinimonas arctica]QDQ25383.1 hypothetical protein FNU76_02880 [Chitinimonas arctica]
MQNRCLTELDLSQNQIGDSGAQRKINAALTRNQKVTKGQSKILLQQGTQFAVAGEVQQAAERFRQALRLGIKYQDRQPIQAALDLVRQQLKQADGHTQSGKAHLQAQRFVLAHAAFVRALAICCDHAAAQQGLQAAHAALMAPPPQPSPQTPTAADLPQQLAEEQQLHAQQQASTRQWHDRLAAQCEQQAQALAAKEQALADLQRQLAQAGSHRRSIAADGALRLRIAALEQDKRDLLASQDELHAHLNILALRIALLAEQQSTPDSSKLSALRTQVRQGEDELVRCQATCQQLNQRAPTQPAALASIKLAAEKLKQVEATVITQREMLARQASLGLVPERRAWQDFLRELKRLRLWQARPAPRCFISYAWETPSSGSANRALQAFLIRLQNDLEKLGMPVQLDISDLSGQIDAYMATLGRCRHVLLIGTPRLLERATAPERNNLQIELVHLRTLRQQQPDALISLLYQGTAEQALPIDLRGSECDFSVPADYAQHMGEPEGGLIPRLLGAAVGPDYQRAWQHFQTKLRPPASTPIDPLAARAAFDAFLRSSQTVLRQHGKQVPVCYLSAATEAKTELAARIEVLVQDLATLGIAVRRSGPLADAAYLLLIGTPAYKQQLVLPRSDIARTFSQVQQRQIEWLPLLFEGKAEDVLPKVDKNVLYRDCSTPIDYYRSLASALNPRGLIPELFGIHRSDKALYKGYGDALQELATVWQ